VAAGLPSLDETAGAVGENVQTRPGFTERTFASRRPQGKLHKPAGGKGLDRGGDLMSTFHEQQTGRTGLGAWTRGRWIVAATIIVAVAAVVVLLVLYTGGGSGGGGGGGY
jgi:hypothetical protein